MWNFQQEEREQESRNFGWNLNPGPAYPAMPAMPMPQPYISSIPQPFMPLIDPYAEADEEDVVEEEAFVAKEAKGIEGYRLVSSFSTRLSSGIFTLVKFNVFICDSMPHRERMG
jgi:hypothetical protein